MKKLSILLFSSLFLFSCHKKESGKVQNSSDTIKVDQKAETEYTCPMHPEVIRKEPGTCPQCGMELQVRS